ncbi:MAG: hypothetical protein LQ350_007327 [Teloschistes chrysophthalmus]|nr:MAG: hypothetical protein LQ350_007327 [Niorma chrysophthalma]
MLLPRYATLVLGASLAHAFTDTSPFFLFSTSELLTSLPQITSSETVTKTVISQLSHCPSDTYVVVSQPGVHVEDYSDRYAAPHLRKKIQAEDKRIRSVATVTDVLGDIDAESLVGAIEEQCGAALLRIDASTGSFTIADDPKPRIIHLDFPSLPPSSSSSPTNRKARVSKLKDNDAFLASILDLLPPTSKYTVVYTTTPSSPSSPSHPQLAAEDHLEQETYEMDTSFSSSQQQQHMELKRDMEGHRMGKRENITLPDAPLFERYQYFTPGIFMGLLVAIPLFLIGYVGVAGVGSLQVSYAAFDKEMGPAAQKKVQ